MIVRRAALAAAILVAATSACGDSDETSNASTVPPTTVTTTVTTTVPATTATTTMPATTMPATTVTATSTAPVPSERIIPLDGDVAEIVFALGFGDQVVATDLSATYPPEADALPQIGYQRALTAEPIAAFEPTLLIGTDIAGPPETLDDLERLGFPLVIVPSNASSTGAAEKIMAVADALGAADDGAVLAAQVQSEIDAAAASAPRRDPAPKVASLYIRGSNARLVFGEAYNTHWLVEAAGGVDVADELGVTEAAEISDEAMIAAAPDVLLLTESGLESVGGVDGLFEQIPALAQTPAGEQRAVIAYDAQLLLGNGPRTGQLLAALIDDLTTHTAPDGETQP
ncbi:MAG: ABC transporter substrate-binding protein [Ilumatobacter fluminis]|uniref:heme/hemin ABC transporter substrate-binding protein n=1 Tax=Ilumatobacter fluminis TaxID=467091 RepID=UPI0032ED2C84